MLARTTRLLEGGTGVIVVVILAIVVTLVTGLVPVWSASQPITVSQYGFPLFWKTHVESTPAMTQASFAFSLTYYSWDAFAMDMFLYAGVGFLFFYWNWSGTLLFRAILITLSSAWAAIATSLFAWPSAQGAFSNGFPVPWMGALSGVQWYYNLTLLVADILIVAAIEVLAFFLYRGFRRSKPSVGLTPTLTVWRRRQLQRHHGVTFEINSPNTLDL